MEHESDLPAAPQVLAKGMEILESSCGKYAVSQAGLFAVRYRKDKKYFERLTHFIAHMIKVIRRITATGEDVSLLIGVTNEDGTDLGEREILVSEFEGTRWIPKYFGPNLRYTGSPFSGSLIREAIQAFSGSIPEEVVHSQIGFVQSGVDLSFCHAGESIGSEPIKDGLVKIELPNAIRDFDLTPLDDPVALNSAIRRVLDSVQLAPSRVMFPLLSLVFRCPLSFYDPLDFVVFVEGKTGSGKSALLGWIQSFYGKRMSDRNFPENWHSTANAILMKSAMLKYVLMVIDDYVNEGRVQTISVNFIRAYRNRASKGRLNSNMGLRDEPRPACGVATSGEDLPPGASILASCFILPIEVGSINFQLLTKFQTEAEMGTFSGLTGSYIRFLIGKTEIHKTTIKRRRLELRAKAESLGLSHRRTGDSVAHLMVGWETFLDFAKERGAVAEAELGVLRAEGWKALCEAARYQTEHQQSEDVALNGLKLLRSVLHGGHAHLEKIKDVSSDSMLAVLGWLGAGNTERPKGPRIGYFSHVELFLDPSTTFAELQKLARNQGRSIAVTQRAFWRTMMERGFVGQSNESGKIGSKRVIDSSGVRYRFVVMKIDLLMEGVHENGMPSFASLTEEGSSK